MQLIRGSLRGHFHKVGLGLFFKLSEAVIELLVPWVVAGMIDVGVSTGDTGFLVRRGVLLLLMAMAGMLCGSLCQYFAADAAGRAGQTLRNRLYRHGMGLSETQVPDDTGKLLNLVTGDVQQIQHGINILIRLGSRVPFLMIGSIIMTLLLNARMSLIFIGGTALVGLTFYLIIRYTLPGHAKIQARQDILARHTREAISGIWVIRAFGREKAEQDSFDGTASGLRRLIIAVDKLASMMNPLSILLVNAAMVFLLWLGAHLVFDGRSTAGEIVAFLSYMLSTLGALYLAVVLILALTRAAAALRRVDSVLQVESAIKDGVGAVPLSGAPLLEFDAVSAVYHKGARAALTDVTFQLERGQTLGIIGGTGSGKSTLAKLVLRLMDADFGAVRFGGVPIANYRLQEFRAQIGYVPQQVILFSGTVRYNMQMAHPAATDAEMWAALEIAQAVEFLREKAGGDLDDGLDFALIEGGKNLSGGQRQRLTIARALLQNPALLILDDAYSALDYGTATALHSALRERCRNTAILQISQRAADIRQAQQILVLEDGVCAGLGTHETLLQESAVYREICATQGQEGLDG